MGKIVPLHANQCELPAQTTSYYFRMAFRMPMGYKFMAQDRWLVMDSRKSIPSILFDEADVIVDLSNNTVLRGPRSVNELNAYHKYDSYDKFRESLDDSPVLSEQDIKENHPYFYESITALSG